MEREEQLRELIRKHIEEMIDEISTSAGAGPYLTPKAFVGDKQDNTAHIQQMAKRIGYTLTNRGKEDTHHGDKLNENYYAYRNDPSKLPHQKIGEAISEINKQFKMIERVLRMNSRLQKETGVSNDKLWKRTQHQMVKLEGKLVELAGRLREMRG